MRPSNFLRLSCCLLCGLVLSVRIGSAGDWTEARVTALVEQLSAPEHAARQQARKQLVDISFELIPQLIEIRDELQAETGVLRVRVLEDIMLADDGRRGERAEQALEVLTFDEGPVGAEAGRVLIRNHQLRESRARVAIERLGGAVTYRDVARLQATRPRFMPAQSPGLGVGFGPPVVPYAVWIFSDWKGKPEDLWHIRRFAYHSELVVYVIRGSGVELMDVRPLAAWIPGLEVQTRGAVLGIQGGLDEAGCSISHVTRNSPADRAHLMPGDRIVALDGEEIRSFYDLVLRLQPKDAGDVVELTVERGSLLDKQTFHQGVKLGSWRASNDDEQAPPPPLFAGPQAQSYHLLQDRPPAVPLPDVPIRGFLR
ncbi:MAG: PDZ domain-containing protein [Planctomycetaceae bacterium]|nr:PDZ domain-containing protein [Planctomycetaceae bacterium]